MKVKTADISEKDKEAIASGNISLFWDLKKVMFLSLPRIMVVLIINLVSMQGNGLILFIKMRRIICLRRFLCLKMQR